MNTDLHRLHHGRPREAMRLEVKVDPEAWGSQYLAIVCPGGGILSVGCGPGVILREVCALDSSITGPE